jgi:hypothetical protein
MIALTAPLLALLAAQLLWPFVARQTSVRLVYLTVGLALAFWYWIPAINILTVGYLGQDWIVPDPAIAAEAVWTVLIYQLSAMAALASLALIIPEGRAPAAPVLLPTRTLGILTLCGATVFLFWSVMGQGPDILVQLMSGLTSARELREYYNFSSSLGDSMRALLEVAVVASALVVLAHETLVRRLGTLASVMAFLAVALVLVATGTRSPLLMAVFVIVLGRATGHGVPGQRPARSRFWFAAGAVGVTAIPIYLAFSARAARTGMASPVLSTLVVHNDMFRELVYVQGQMADYRGESSVAFLLTPFTYMLPTLFGFVRHIPDHLLAFNGARANIDLILGKGNVFPGLIADNALVFGNAGPLWLAAFVVAFTLALRALGRIAGSSVAGVAVQTAASAFLFFSFRNLHPGLALVLVGGAVALWCLQVTNRQGWPAGGHAYRP